MRKLISMRWDVDDNLKRKYRLGCSIRRNTHMVRIDIIEDEKWGAVCELSKRSFFDQSGDFELPDRSTFEDRLAESFLVSLFMSEIRIGEEDRIEANVLGGVYKSYTRNDPSIIEDGITMSPLEEVLFLTKGKKMEEYNKIWKLKNGGKIQRQLKAFRKDMRKKMIRVVK